MSKEIFTDFEMLNAAVSLARGIIVYTPIESEPDWEQAGLTLLPDADIVRLPADKHADAFAYAEEMTGRFKGKIVAIFVPGRLFDCGGTRHGRGGGWYDRFLSRVPKDWVRIGVADATHVSRETIHRQTWDEPMDWILAHDATSGAWKAHETKARSILA